MPQPQNSTLPARVETAAVTSALSLTFDRLVAMIAPESGDGMVAASSARVYRATYAKWQAWAAAQGIAPLDLNYNTVQTFLGDHESAKATKQRQLSALRKLADVLAVLDFQNPARKAACESLKLLKVRNGGGTRQSNRQKRALPYREAQRLLDYWGDLPAEQGPPQAIRARNAAIMAVLLLTGVRRSELAALRWQDVDFENGVIHIASGKGDKARDVAVYGQTALDALKRWQIEQPSGYAFVFTRFAGRAGRFGPDKPMTAQAIYNIFTLTGERSGVGKTAPHDARRTLLTELLATGTPLQDVQAQAGHARGDTTLAYAQAVDARQRRKQGRVRYG